MMMVISEKENDMSTEAGKAFKTLRVEFRILKKIQDDRNRAQSKRNRAHRVLKQLEYAMRVLSRDCDIATCNFDPMGID